MLAVYHGSGKLTALNTALEKKLRLQSIDKRESNIDDIVSESSTFLTQCYGCPDASMTEYRQKVWATSIPELSERPPSNETALHNIKAARYQVYGMDERYGSMPSM